MKTVSLLLLAVGVAAVIASSAGAAYRYDATFSSRSWDQITGSPFDGVDGSHDGTFHVRDNGYLGAGTGGFYNDQPSQGHYNSGNNYTDAWSTSGSSDSGFNEYAWEFQGLGNMNGGYVAKIIAVDLDNYPLQKPYASYPTHWTGDPAYGGVYKWPEVWEITYDGTGSSDGVSYTGTGHNLTICPDATNGWTSTTYHLFSSVQEGDVVVGINGTFYPGLETNYPNSYFWNTSNQRGIRWTELLLIPAGDKDEDGDVDLSDFTPISVNYLKTTANGIADGDYNLDGTVNLSDFSRLSVNFTGSLTGSSVPEPATIGLVTLGVLALLRRRSA
jgi:hypothetical protein